MLIRRRTIILIVTLILANKYGFAQVKNDNLLWSQTRKLTANDFVIKTKPLETTPSYGQFSMEYQISGFDFLTKNFNKKVRNYFLRTASWIDTTTNVDQSLLYQQTVFDLCEVYTRQFRKALRDNRKKIATGMQIAKDLNDHFVTEFAKRRLDYDGETQFGTDLTKQQEWEAQIANELAELKEYSYEK